MLVLLAFLCPLAHARKMLKQTAAAELRRVRFLTKRQIFDGPYQ
jgi:hypothetical protein